MSRPNTGKMVGIGAVVALLLGAILWMTRGPTAEESADADTKADSAEKKQRRGADSDALAKLRRRKDPSSQPKASVAGLVSDGSGNAIPGATVCAELADDEVIAPRMPAACSTTGKDGRYLIAELMPAGYAIHAAARGFQPTQFSDHDGPRGSYRQSVKLPAGDTVQNIDLQLEAGGAEIKGVVKDVAGGVIPNAYVTISSGSWRSRHSAFAVTDAEGQFTAWGPSPEASVTAWTEGYASRSLDVATPGTFVELLLTPESVVVGKVVWADSGKPAPGVEVSADGTWWSRGEAVLTDDSGEFRIEGLDPGNYKVEAQTINGFGQSDAQVHVGLGESSEPITVRIHPAFYAKGLVTIGPEEPCENARVELMDPVLKRENRRSAKADADGLVIIEALLPGTYEVKVTCRGYLAEESIPDVVVVDANLEGLHWEVQEALAIRGTVTDSNGKPVRGAWIYGTMVEAAGEAKRRTNGYGERTDENGEYELSGLIAGTYKINASSDDHPNPLEPLEVELESGADENGVDIELPQAGTISGTVKDENGQSVALVDVRASGPGWGGDSAKTNDNGEYEITAVRPGEYTVHASRGWGNEMRAPGSSDDDVQGERVTVEGGESTTVDFVVESQGGTIGGTVVDESGQPIADAFVSATRESDSAAGTGQANRRARFGWGSWDTKPVLTDQDGNFEIPDLAESAKYTVRANRKGGGDGITEHVATGSNVEVAIESVGSIAGVVTLAGGGYPERFSITAKDTAAGIYRSDDAFRTEGKFILENVPPGEYEVVATSASGDAKTTVSLGDSEAKSDVKLQLTPRVTITGTLVDADSGEPVQGLKVTARAESGNMYFGFGGEQKTDTPDISDAAGRFEIKDAPTGKVNFTAMRQGSWMDDSEDNYGWNSFFRRIPSEPEVQDLGELKVIKNRMKNSETQGDLGFKFKEIAPDSEPEDRVLEVAVVRPGGPAAEAGLKAGDIVNTMEGKDVTGINSSRSWKLMRVPEGKTVKMGLEEGGTVTVTAGPPV